MSHIAMQGKLRISLRGWIVVDLDEDFGDYYRWFLPKSLHFNLPMYSPHITVARDFPILEPFEPYVVSFEYDPHTEIRPPYIWLNVWSDDLAAVRTRINYPVHPFYLDPPEGYGPFHISLGNMKGL